MVTQPHVSPDFDFPPVFLGIAKRKEVELPIHHNYFDTYRDEDGDTAVYHHSEFLYRLRCSLFVLPGSGSNPNSGCYLLFRQHECIYIGESGGVVNRLGQHWSGGAGLYDQPKRFTWAIVIPEVNRRYRIAMENFLIRGINPDENKRCRRDLTRPGPVDLDFLCRGVGLSGVGLHLHPGTKNAFRALFG